MLLVVTEDTGDVAMLLINKKGKLFINEAGWAELRRVWKTPGVYTNNMLLFIPQMATQLRRGELWVTGVRIMPNSPVRPGGKSKPLG